MWTEALLDVDWVWSQRCRERMMSILAGEDAVAAVVPRLTQECVHTTMRTRARARACTHPHPRSHTRNARAHTRTHARGLLCTARRSRAA